MIERVIMPFGGTEMGGSHISAFTLGEALQREHGVRVVVYAVKDTLIARNAAERGFKVRSLNESRHRRHNPLYDAIRLPARLMMLRSEGPNVVVHSNDIGSLQSWGPAAKLLGRPIVYHNRAFNRPILPNTIVMRLADKMVCISDSIRRAISFLPARRIATVLNPFELNAAPERATARGALLNELDLMGDSLVIGFVANFWERKRPHFFLDVCGRIADRRPEARFILFGRDGDYTVDDLRRHAERIGIAQQTRFPGFRLPGENNIAALDLLLMPAIKEPFGRTPVEALLLGTPYVATDDAGHGEIGRRWGGGQLVPLDADVERFAEVALAVLDDPDRTRLPESRRREISDEISAKAHAAKMMDIYRELHSRA